MDATDKMIAVLSAIIGVTIIAVIISKKSATTSVISAAASGFGGILGVAVSPITGTAPPQLASFPSGPSNQGAFTQQGSGGGVNPSSFLGGAGGLTGNPFGGGTGGSNDPFGGLLNSQTISTAAPFVAAAFL